MNKSAVEKIGKLCLKVVNFFLSRLIWLLKAYIHRSDELESVYWHLFWGKK